MDDATSFRFFFFLFFFAELFCCLPTLHSCQSHSTCFFYSSVCVLVVPVFSTIGSQQMPRSVKDAKIAFLDFNLQKVKMDMGVQVIVDKPEELKAIRQREADIIKERVELILKAGANVVLTTKGIDDLCLKYLVSANAIGVRRCRREDLVRIAGATGGTLVTTLGDLDGNESFDASLLGSAKLVEQVRVADDELILIKGAAKETSASVILRGSNYFALDEIERSLHDALCIVKRVLESGHVVAGGGAVEVALSVYLEDFAKSLGSREQLAIAEFARALLVIPKTLASNAACDASELVAQLRAQHHAAQADASEATRRFAGLDLRSGAVRDNLAAGVVEPALAKVKSLRFATEAGTSLHWFTLFRCSFLFEFVFSSAKSLCLFCAVAVSLLRVDELIKLNPEKKQEDPHGH